MKYTVTPVGTALSNDKFIPILKGIWRLVSEFWVTWITVLAPIVVLAIPYSAPPHLQQEMWCAYAIVVMAIYWIFECVPLAITSLLPVVLLPLSGVLSTGEVCINYLKGTSMMFLAGLMMAIAVEHSGLHHRIALNVIKLVGTSRKLIMLGFMACTMFLSMWISNTAATAMMIPIVEAIDDAVSMGEEPQDEETGMEEEGKKAKEGGKEGEEAGEESKEEVEKKKGQGRNFLLLSCAYAANIGGTGVITGSPPNLVVLSNLNRQFGDGKTPLSYASWMAFAVPLMLLNTCLAWGWILLLQKLSSPGEKPMTKEKEEKVKALLMEQKRKLGKITPHELQVLILFCILIVLWFFQSPGFITGWASFFKVSVSSATPAALMVVLVFIFPKNPSLTKSSPALVDWHTVEKKLPWGVILLLGGGFALSEATEKSGLSVYLAEQLGALSSLDSWQVNLIVAIAVTFVTEVASNTATASIVIPILVNMSMSLCLNPIYLTVTAAISCSYAFMLPVATAPNAIVFSHSTMKTSDMMKAGFGMNLVCIITTTILINTIGIPIYGLGDFPSWAETESSKQCFNMTSTLLDTDIVTDLPSPLAG